MAGGQRSQRPVAAAAFTKTAPTQEALDGSCQAAAGSPDLGASDTHSVVAQTGLVCLHDCCTCNFTFTITILIFYLLSYEVNCS